MASSSHRITADGDAKWDTYKVWIEFGGKQVEKPPEKFEAWILVQIVRANKLSCTCVFRVQFHSPFILNGSVVFFRRERKSSDSSGWEEKKNVFSLVPLAICRRHTYITGRDERRKKNRRKRFGVNSTRSGRWNLSHYISVHFLPHPHPADTCTHARVLNRHAK